MPHAVSSPPSTAHRGVLVLFILACCSLWMLDPLASGPSGGQVRTPQGRVENVQVGVKGGLVDLTFDLLSDDPKALFRVSVLVSADGGVTYEPTAVSLTGDVKNVAPGLAKRIVWDAGKDTDNVSLERLRYRLIAEAEQPTVPRNAGLAVSTDPPGATVTVDGLARGSSPVKLVDLAPGDHQVTLVREGYLENSRKVMLAAGESQTLHVKLTPDPAAARPKPATAPAKTGEKATSGKSGSPLKWILALAGGGAAVGALLATKGGGDSAPPEPSCTYTLSTGTAISGPASGGSFPVTVTTASGCTWSATSNAPWIHAQAPTSGTGTGVFTFTVDANTGTARTGTLTIAGSTVTFSQSTATYTLNATLAQGLNLSGPYAATLTGPNGFSCSMSQSQQSVTCAPVSYTAGTTVPILVTVTIPSFANAAPILSATGCDSLTINTCTVVMNTNKTVTIRAGQL